ncbi:MAG: polysaccharide deacetylase family protein [Leptolyngbyaceae cyanobacterium bins.349]|nr:polysaccharide deacetylase family protein [Leptolyngbyaceae cyanobacterium bins.349]
MTYSPSDYQPSVLAMARQGNFQAIAYWINSILAPQGIHIQANTGRTGKLTLMVNFPRTHHRQACLTARQRLVRHICYRLWTLNSKAISEVRIMARVAGQRDILWRQTVRISAPAKSGPGLRKATPASRSRTAKRGAKQERFNLLRSFLLNRLAIAGFLLCYWVIYLETTGHQAAEPPVAAVSPAQVQEVNDSNGQEKTAIAHARPQPQNQVFTVPPQFQGQIIHEATPPANAEKVVALTFDDGPWKQTTEQILDILKQNNIKSTFYFVGQAIQEHPSLAKKVVEQGHAVGNHTWQHPMENIDAATAAQELGNTARLIYEATGGVRTYLMRPPGGNLEGDLANYAKQQGYMVTMWSADSSDYLVSAPLIVDNVLSQVKPGGIVLMHDGGGDRSATVEALPQIISALQRQGYKFVTVPELMELQAKWSAMTPLAPTPGWESAPTEGSPTEGSPTEGSPAGVSPMVPAPTELSPTAPPPSGQPSAHPQPLNFQQPEQQTWENPPANAPHSAPFLDSPPSNSSPEPPAPAPVPNAEAPPISPAPFVQGHEPDPAVMQAATFPIQPELEPATEYAP